MKITEVVSFLNTVADPSYQEDYDNAGLIAGDPQWECSGIICTLDATEEVVREAARKKCNLIIAHHPILFRGLKRINGRNYVERTIITAIKNDIAIFALHTNLDNVSHGVNGKIAQLLGLNNCTVLLPKENTLKKLFTFVPVEHAERVRSAVFDAGGGHIGNYSECSFNAEGMGTFRAGESANPFVGKKGERHSEKEIKVEVIFPFFLENKIVQTLVEAHPYEEPAYDVVSLSNPDKRIGSGIIGQLPEAMHEKDFLVYLKRKLNAPVVRHTALTGKEIRKVAVCGGAGSFLITRALSAGADSFVTADLKYHDFFDAENKMLIADPGHYETEQFTIELLQQILQEKFPTFAVLKTEVNTNPVHYF